ncbi:MAG: HAMP domain-containing protein, partial [Magnetococcales bacterium]|nr:HAMP domain-containing protein [Magnetococcales bacterium]
MFPLKSSLGVKILLPVGILILLVLLGLVTFYAKNQETAILRQHQVLLEQLADHITRGIKTVMVAGYADIAQEYAENMKNSQIFHDIRVLRTNGEEAFLDNSTINQVNLRLGTNDFLPKKVERMVRVLDSQDEYLTTVLQEKELLSYFKETPQGEIITYLVPIMIEKRCYRCHGKSQEVRGVLHLSASTQKVRQDIEETQKRAYRIVAVSILALLLVLLLLVRRTILYPVKLVTDAMSRVVGGDYSQKVPVTGEDEVAHMANSFNVMTGKLESTYSGLEREVVLRKDAEERMTDYARKLEQVVQERTRQLVHADRLAALGTFSAGMAHEINNPNSFVQGNIQFLKKFWDLAHPIVERHAGEDGSGRVNAFHGQIQETLDGILDGSQRISRIVDSLKTYSKSGTDLDKVVCRVADPVHDALNLLRYRINKGVVTDIRIANTLTIYCDRQQMCQVFVNLMVNAMDAMEESGQKGERRLGVRAEEMEEHLWIWVEDNGPGIPPEAAGRLFDPFFTTKGKTKGTGLGLSIVHGIVEDHGGQITVFSAPGS